MKSLNAICLAGGVTLVSTFSTLYSTSVFAMGGSHGGGGVGVRCNDSHGKTLSFEMLDIYEARQRGLTLLPSPKSENEAVQFVADLLNPSSHFPNDLDSAQQQRRDTMKTVRAEFDGQPEYDGKKVIRRTVFGGALLLSNDFGSYQLAKNCHLEQVAYFTDEDLTVHIDQSKWRNLSWLNRVALIAHEGAYFMFRERAVENSGLDHPTLTSERSRRAIGDILSTKGIAAKAAGLPPTGYLECLGADSEIGTDFYSYKSNGKTTLIFETLNAKTSPYELKASFSQLNLIHLLMPESEIAETTSPLEFVGETDSPPIYLSIHKDRFQKAVLKTFRKTANGDVQALSDQQISCDPYYSNRRLSTLDLPMAVGTLHFPSRHEIPPQTQAFPDVMGAFVQSTNSNFSPTLEIVQSADSEIELSEGPFQSRWKTGSNFSTEASWGRAIAYWNGDTLVHILQFRNPSAIVERTYRLDAAQNLVVTVQTDSIANPESVTYQPVPR